MDYYPSINKPTHITANSHTLIDKILTNELFTSCVSGILVSDINDHLPVCAFINYNVVDCKTSKQDKWVRDM